MMPVPSDDECVRETASSNRDNPHAGVNRRSCGCRAMQRYVCTAFGREASMRLLIDYEGPPADQGDTDSPILSWLHERVWPGRVAE